MPKRSISKEHQEVYENALAWIAEKQATPADFSSRLRTRFARLQKPQAVPVLKLLVGDVEIRWPMANSLMEPRALALETMRQTAMLTATASAHRTFAMKLFVQWVQYISENKSKLPPDARDYPSKISEGQYTLTLEFEQ